jgi:hypothetical protein
MAMLEVVCADCGAINRMSADACWRCLEMLATAAPVSDHRDSRPAVQPRFARA